MYAGIDASSVSLLMYTPDPSAKTESPRTFSRSEPSAPVTRYLDGFQWFGKRNAFVDGASPLRSSLQMPPSSMMWTPVVELARLGFILKFEPALAWNPCSMQ